MKAFKMRFQKTWYAGNVKMEKVHHCDLTDATLGPNPCFCDGMIRTTRLNGAPPAEVKPRATSMSNIANEKL